MVYPCSQLNLAIQHDVLARLRPRVEEQGLLISVMLLRAIRELLDGKARSPELSLGEGLKLLEAQERDLGG